MHGIKKCYLIDPFYARQDEIGGSLSMASASGLAKDFT